MEQTTIQKARLGLQNREEEIIERILRDVSFRKQITRESFYWFFATYFEKYIEYPMAPMHRDMAQVLADWENKFVEILGFRESAKSVWAVLALPIWAMITGKAHLILLLGDTFEQIKLHIENIKSELEMNEKLIKDWGAFDVKIEEKTIAGMERASDEWTKRSILVPRYDCRIMARSTGQPIRGVRHKQFRPDLIVGDDIENDEMVRNKEQRDKVYRWWTSVVIPAGAKGKTKYVLVGNLLHSDGLMARIMREVLNGVRDGVIREYPILKGGEILWPGKFRDEKEIEKEKRKVADVRTWQREYMLKMVPEEGQVIKDGWIKYWDRLPIEDGDKAEGELVYIATGIDLAISKKEDADYTAMVSAKVYMMNDDSFKIYILPNMVNERLGFHETIDTAGSISVGLGDGTATQLFVEEVAYQKAAIEEMGRRLLPAMGIKPGGKDKRARLFSVSNLIANGQVLFPREGAEDLIIQLTGFGVEAHDDLMDALVILLLGVSRWGLQKQEITYIPRSALGL
jgi:predicted phage terminase large subunit-like protein